MKLRKGIGERGIRVLEAMIDQRIIPFDTRSIDAQHKRISKWDDNHLSLVEQFLKIPTPQKIKVGEDKSQDKQMIGSTDGVHLDNTRHSPKKKVGS